MRSLGERSGSDLRDAHLLEQGQVILNVPVVGNLDILTFTRLVAMNSIGCPLPYVGPNFAREMAGERHVDSSAIELSKLR
jgi:hypothetical protein